MEIGFIGLGNMGKPIAQNLIKAGHSLTVYNRTAERADGLSGCKVADSPAGAAHGAEVLITMLADDHAVEQTLLGDHPGAAFRSLRAGAVHISMSTISVALSQRLADAHRQGGHKYVSAPVFGRPQAAADAGLLVVAAGEPEAVERCQPIFSAIGRATSVVAENPEAANAVKLTGNFTIAAVLETLGEAVALVRKQGVAPEQFLEILNLIFRSPVYQIYGGLIAGQHFEPAGFRTVLGLKDVRLALAAADSSNVPMPLASLLHDRLMAACGRGRADQDWSSIAAVIAEEAGL
ncbi:MAG TPA: NAD(P)-dependent oxidoreductase [Blastocatellia bacterium]